jgi:hypothetical protein
MNDISKVAIGAIFNPDLRDEGYAWKEEAVLRYLANELMSHIDGS